jgi:Golgi phosphoprotein 3 (GPP34)
MSTELPKGLADRAFLVAYDAERKKLAGAGLGLLVRAAALQELLDAGLLVDDGGKARVGRGRTDDPYLDALQQRVAASAKPRSWQHWVAGQEKEAYLSMRDRLADARLVRVERVRKFGLFPCTQVHVRDTRPVRDLRARLRRAVMEGSPLQGLDPRDAALAPLVAAAELDTVFSGRERRTYRDRVKALGERSGPVAKALRKAVVAKQAAAASAGATTAITSATVT